MSRYDTSLANAAYAAGQQSTRPDGRAERIETLLDELRSALSESSGVRLTGELLDGEVWSCGEVSIGLQLADPESDTIGEFLKLPDGPVEILILPRGEE